MLCACLTAEPLCVDIVATVPHLRVCAITRAIVPPARPFMEHSYRIAAIQDPAFVPLSLILAQTLRFVTGSNSIPLVTPCGRTLVSFRRGFTPAPPPHPPATLKKKYPSVTRWDIG